MLRVIREFKPQWVVGENVTGLLTIEQGVVLEQVCLDLEGEGYEVQPFVIPACAVNAPHRRDRVWIVGNRASDRRKWGVSGRPLRLKKGHEERSESAGQLERRPQGSHSDASDSLDKGLEGGGECEKNTRESSEGRKGASRGIGQLCGLPIERGWDENWLEVAGDFCRVYDGLPSWLDGHFTEVIYDQDYAPIKNKPEELRALWKAVQSEQIQERVGGIFKIPEKEVLFAFLLRLQKESIGAGKQVADKESDKYHSLRTLWENAGFRSSSQGRESYEQWAKELVGVVPELSYEVAQCVAKIWYFLTSGYSATVDQETMVGDKKISASKHRAERLKGLGNAWVPAVAEVIMNAIKEIQRSKITQ